MSTHEKALTLKALHEAPEILRVVNVWDAITTRVVADLPGTRAIATAGHSIAASHGYADGAIPLELALAALERIVAATDLPVSADLDAGYGDPAETVRRAIGVGVVGANVEDRLAPFADAVARGRAFLEAGASLVFVPGVLDRAVTERLVAGLGRGRLSVIGLPGALAAAEYEALGVARISYGPTTQRVALRAFRDLAEDLYADGVVPLDTPALN